MKYLSVLLLVAIAMSCSNIGNHSDAYGNFEAVTVSVSAETAGKIISLAAEEGSELTKGTVVAIIDTTDFYLKLLQLQAQKRAIAVRKNNVQAQVQVQEQQKANLLVERARVLKLLEDKAATSKQLDDINGAIELVDRQIGSIKTQNAGIDEEIEVVDRQVAQVRESIKKCYIINPVKGTVLVKYAEAGEVTVPGKVIYKIADLGTMELKVYVSGDQLPQVKLGNTAEVWVDKDKKTNRKLSGTVSWISQKAEFTPKIIQTKEERVNLVYGVKVKVANDGTLKIAMPGEVNFR